MSQDQRNQVYRTAVRYGRVLDDFAQGNARLMRIRHNGYIYNVCLLVGEVFALSLECDQ